MKKPEWRRVKWHGNKAKPYCDWECWQWKQIVLFPGQWPEKGWSYVRKGAASEHAHTGFLPCCITLESAQDEIARRVSIGKIVP